jgi:hypothetical protein
LSDTAFTVDFRCLQELLTIPEGSVPGVKDDGEEALGEGWYVLASDHAVKAIRQAFPNAQTHLWVERHFHGKKPYKGSWHLRQPF